MHVCDSMTVMQSLTIKVLFVSSIDLQFHNFKNKVQTTYIPMPYIMLHCGKIIIHFEQDFLKTDNKSILCIAFTTLLTTVSCYLEAQLKASEPEWSNQEDSYKKYSRKSIIPR